MICQQTSSCCDTSHSSSTAAVSLSLVFDFFDVVNLSAAALLTAWAAWRNGYAFDDELGLMIIF